MRPALVWAGGFGLLVMFYLPMCAAHIRPVQIENDTSSTVKLDLSPYKILPEYSEGITALPTKAGDGYGLLSCSKKWEFAYLSTLAHPDFVAYRVKDICDPDECSCVIKVSDLEKKRTRLAVPWQQAGMAIHPSNAIR